MWFIVLKGDLDHEGSCYHLPRLEKTWSDAAAFCSSNNAHLVTLNNRYTILLFGKMTSELMNVYVMIGLLPVCSG